MSAATKRDLARFRPAHRLWNYPLLSVVVGKNVRTGRPIWIPREMLEIHLLTMGSTGGGKSKAMVARLIQHTAQFDGVRRGVTLIDRHGALVREAMEIIASGDLQRHRRIVVWRPGDPDAPVLGFHPLRVPPGTDPSVVVDAAVSAVSAVWGDEDLTQTPLLRQAMSCVFYAIATNELTLLEAVDLVRLEDASGLRAFCAARIEHPVYRAFFEDLAAMQPTRRREELGSTVRRLHEFLRHESTRLIFGQREKVIDFRKHLDEGGILLIDLSTGPWLSETVGKLIGTLVVNALFLACLGRPKGALPHFLMVDEAHCFITEDMADILDQARKFSLFVDLAVQTGGQLREKGERIYRSVMANCHTKIIFGGLDEADTTELAKNLYRGSFDLQRAKHRYDKFVPVGQELAWLLSESESVGSSVAVGTNWSQGGSTARHESTTKSTSTTETDSVSETHSTAETTTETEGESRSESYDYDFKIFAPGQLPHTRHEGETTSSSRSTSETTGHAVTRGHATSRTEGVAETEGTTNTNSWSRGGGVTNTKSNTTTNGRAQTFRTLYQKQVATPYSLDELIHMASVTLTNLPRGQCIVKIGKRPPVRVKTLHIRDRRISAEHLARAQAEMSNAPFMQSRDEARTAYAAYRAALMRKVARRPGDDE